MMILLAGICLAYLLGSIPTGVIAGRLKGIDVRKAGSGNVGATNVTRVVGKLPGLIVLIVDILKGWFPVKILSSLLIGWGVAVSPDLMKILFGVAAVAGHIWNPWLEFKGGKGVATALGVLLALDPRVCLGAVAVWIIAAFLTRYVSVASSAAAIAAPFLMIFLNLPVSWTLGAIAVSLAILFRHRENYLRLLHREEHRIGSR